MDLRGRKEQEGENYRIKSFIICTLHQISTNELNYMEKSPSPEVDNHSASQEILLPFMGAESSLPFSQ
jgi:hypothetical protein